MFDQFFILLYLAFRFADEWICKSPIVFLYSVDIFAVRIKVLKALSSFCVCVEIKNMTSSIDCIKCYDQKIQEDLFCLEVWSLVILDF